MRSQKDNIAKRFHSTWHLRAETAEVFLRPISRDSGDRLGRALGCPLPSHKIISRARQPPTHSLSFILHMKLPIFWPVTPVAHFAGSLGACWVRMHSPTERIPTVWVRRIRRAATIGRCVPPLTLYFSLVEAGGNTCVDRRNRQGGGWQGSETKHRALHHQVNGDVG